MTKKQFANFVLLVVASLIFALGMCMCLLPEWNAFLPGVIMTAAGGAVLLVMGLIAFFRRPHDLGSLNWRLVGKVSFGVLSALVLGLGMAMIMSWDMLLIGISVGIVGVVMLLALIPMFFGFKD